MSKLPVRLFYTGILLLSACNFPILKKEKILPIREDQIAEVYFTSHEDPDQIIRVNWMDMSDFVEGFNASESAGMYKFVAEYKLEIHFRDSSVRSFRIHDDLIKEKGDFAFRIKKRRLEELYTKYNPVINVRAGEHFEIYHIVPPALAPDIVKPRKFCWSGDKTMFKKSGCKPYDNSQCEGCHVRVLEEFQALKKGTDTLFVKFSSESEDCEVPFRSEKYYIVVAK